jgi:hypothetical protein
VGDSTQTVATAEPVAQKDGFAEAEEMPSAPTEALASTTAEPRRATNDPRARPRQVAAITVVTSSVPVPLSGPIDTSLPPPVSVSATTAPRPANDPRRSRAKPLAESLASAPEAQVQEATVTESGADT